MSKYIITGGPGAGKTTLLQALKQQGYGTSDEASRQLIIEEVNNGSKCLPWMDLPCFALKALERMVQLYNNAPPEVTFFDRGIPDIIAYLKAAALPVDKHFYHTLNRHPYHPVVFLAPPWQEIYVNDSERWQTFKEAVALYHTIKETYLTLGYTLVELPLASVQERVNFVSAYIQK